MADTDICVYCKKKKLGRFTRPKTASGRGWQQGFILPVWSCYVCLPQGEGRGEEVEMAKTTPTPPTPAPISFDKERDESLAMVTTIAQEVTTLKVRTAEDYLRADDLLGRVGRARKQWGIIWDRIQEKSIKPIRAGLEGLYEMNRSIDPPLEKLEKVIKGQMTAFKLQEERERREAEEERERERLALEQEAAEKERQLAAAKTPATREKLRTAIAGIKREAEVINLTQVPEQVRGASSTTRTVATWRIVDRAKFLKEAHPNYLMENTAAIDAMFKLKPEVVACIPGVEVYDDVQVVKR